MLVSFRYRIDSLLGFVVAGLKEALKALNVKSGSSKAVRVRRQRFRVNVLNQFVKVDFAFHPQVDDG